MPVPRSLPLLVAVAACGLPDGDYFGHLPAHVDRDHFRWCNQGEPESLDPARASSTISQPLVVALFAGLTHYGPDGNPRPALATHWDIDADHRTFTFHLRRDARFSNGRALTAYDVAYSALRLADPLTAAPNVDHLAPVEHALGYLARTTLVLRRGVGPYKSGEIVERVGDATGPALALRTASRGLALRDLGAPATAAYARVAPGAAVALVLATGGRATPPDVGGERWAYVHADGPGEVYGWVPARELDGEPAAGHALIVRTPDGPPVLVHGRDVAHSTDAIGIAVPDPYTIVFTCRDPTPYFLALTASRGLRVVASEVVSRWPRSWTDPARIATSGPLHLAAWLPRDRIELVRAPTYWDPAEVRTARVTAYAIDDQAAATNFYFTAGCDATAANVMPSSYLPALTGELRGRPYRDFRVDPMFAVYFLWLQTERLPSRHLRRALSLAIDRRGVPRFTHGQEIATAQLTPGTPIAQLAPADLAACGVARDQPGVALVMEAGALCYVPPPGLDFDPTAARAELAAARAELGPRWREPLEYRYNAGSEAHKQIAEYLQVAWARIGLRVELRAQDFNSLLEDTRTGNYDIARLGNVGQIADTESEFLPLFRCGSPDNRGRYCSAEVEQLLATARGLRDRRARNAALARAEAVIVGDAPVVPIYVYTQKHLIKPYVRDYAVNLVGQPSLWRVWLDPAATEGAR